MSQITGARASNSSMNRIDIETVNDYDFSINNPSFMQDVAPRKPKRPQGKNMSGNRYDQFLSGHNSALAMTSGNSKIMSIKKTLNARNSSMQKNPVVDSGSGTIISTGLETLSFDPMGRAGSSLLTSKNGTPRKKSILPKLPLDNRNQKHSGSIFTGKSRLQPNSELSSFR